MARFFCPVKDALAGSILNETVVLENDDSSSSSLPSSQMANIFSFEEETKRLTWFDGVIVYVEWTLLVLLFLCLVLLVFLARKLYRQVTKQ